MEKKVRETEARLAGIVEAAMDAIITIDGQHRIVLFNPAAQAMFGITADDALGQSLERFIPQEFRACHDQFIRRFREAGTTSRRMGALGAVSALRANGEAFPAEASISHVRIGEDHLATVILRDISERKRHEEARQLLAREVDHRAKNALAVAQALVSLTRAETIQDYAQAVKGRLAALARAHGLLSEGAWQGADLHRTISDELAAYAKPGHSIVTGPVVRLTANAVQPLSLVMHELATNAVKHGALRHADGRITVEWSIESDRRLAISWTETGGPPVTPPSARGFGSRLLNDVIRKQLRGDLTLDWAAPGLRVTILLNDCFDAIENNPAIVGAPATELPCPQSAASARRVLVVEDEALVALELSCGLEDLGWSIIGPASSLETARALLRETDSIDAAVLDINVAGQLVYPLAHDLRGRGVPILFCSGYDAVDAGGRFADVPILSKPVNIGALHQALHDISSCR